MPHVRISLAILLVLLSNFSFAQSSLPLKDVKITDTFWSPKLKIWHTNTVYDVLDKLEGKYEPDREDLIKEKAAQGHTRNAFRNFDLVAQGKKNTGASDGPPWYDGLVYETIRGAADLLTAYPDARLEQKLDAYISRIAAAQAADPDGYINTYTTLNRPDQRWGTNGGDERWQHDIYNAGMLMEAGVHYYRATGKTKLLEVAVKMTNYMCSVMGAAPKQNIIPGHAGPEEALLKMYLLFKNEPALKQQIKAPVNEADYYTLVKYWIEQRGIYADADGSRKRTNYGSYNQDQMPVFEQKTIEGHAVRATLLGTAVAAMAAYNQDARYINTANNYWNNMAGRRMFITGGQGAIAQDEKFGEDYFLPESAYLETCAAIGAGFFSERMNELQADGKYVDELERVLYNNMLSGVGFDGVHYHYENPLLASEKRWAWHSCPCCPPMFLKMAGALPGFIYARHKQDLYINLFIGSEAQVNIDKNKVKLKQETKYPWNGYTQITVTPEHPAAFSVYVRIPGWATGKENPFDLYRSSVDGKVSLRVNGSYVAVNPVNGYIVLNRTWKKGDVITLNLPVKPRLVAPAPEVATIKGKLAIAAGPLVYAVEGTDNPNMNNYRISEKADLQVNYHPEITGGINVISGSVDTGHSKAAFKAIPFYAVGNRGTYPYMVWLKH